MNNYNNQDPNGQYNGQNYPPQNYMPPQQYPQYPMPKPPQGMSIAGLVLGIVGVVFSFAFYIGIPCAILALIFGIKTRNDFKKMGLTNSKSTAAFVLGLVGLILSIIFLIFIIFVISQAMDTYSYYSSFTW